MDAAVFTIFTASVETGPLDIVQAMRRFGFLRRCEYRIRTIYVTKLR